MEATTDQLSIKCPNCGSPKLGYSAKSQALDCPYCGYTNDLPQEKDEIIERPLNSSYSLADSPTGLDIPSKIFHCNSCGSNTSIPKDQVRFVCPFCSSENVNEEAQEMRVIRPSGVLGFTVTQKEALEKFKTWLGRGWFHPNNLVKFAQLDKIKGVYLPFWTYDAYTESEWEAEAGYYYYVQETVRGPDGKPTVRTVQKVRWRHARGFFEHFFDDVLVSASKGVSQRMAEKVYPFALNEVVNYNSKYLLGWGAELYQKDIQDGFKTADSIMDNFIRQGCARQIPGDTHRNLRVRTQKTNLTFKHLLLPIWIAGYKYNDKIFQFIVNGQTGKVGGEKPLSPIKIAIAVILGLLVVGAIVFFAEYSESIR